MPPATYTLHRATDDACIGQRTNPAALVNLAEIAGKGCYYVHNGVGVVAACEVQAKGKTREIERHPYIGRKDAGLAARRIAGIAD